MLFVTKSFLVKNTSSKSQSDSILWSIWWLSYQRFFDTQ